MKRMISDILNRRDGKKAKGFTLIELLVVVVIIGILAAIAVPIYLNQRKAAWNSSVESDVKNASLVVETAATANNGSTVGLGVYTTAAGTTAVSTGTGGYTITAPAYIGLGGSAPNEITVSNGNTLVINMDSSNGYTITGYRTSNDTGKQYVYDSNGGTITQSAKS